MHIEHDILNFCNFVGSIAFMTSGAMSAIKREMDISGAFVLSVITGVGGGTIRDLLVNRNIFWMENNWYIYLAIACTLFVFVMHRIQPNLLKAKTFINLISFIDSLGLIPFMLAGISVGIITHQTDLVTVMLGIITCVGGGIIKDLICQEVPIIFQEDLYATSVLVGSLIYLIFAPFDKLIAILFSGISLLSMRIISIKYNLHLPKT